MTVSPAADQSGTATITVTVSDGALTASDTFVLTVTPVNDPPTISDIVNLSIDEDEATGALPFDVGDVETAAASLTVSGTSSNTTLVPNANIVFGGSGANRTVTVTPAANQNGTATITVTVSDGALDGQRHVRADGERGERSADDFSDIANQTINEDTATGALTFTVGDAETAAASLTVSGSSVEHDAGAQREHRLWRQRGEPDGDGDAGGQSERDGDDHGDGERRGADRQRHVRADGHAGERSADDSATSPIRAINEDTATGALHLHGGRRGDGGGEPDGERDVLEHDAGAQREHRLWRQRREPDGDGDAGGQSDRDGDDHGDGERRGVERQ